MGKLLIRIGISIIVLSLLGLIATMYIQRGGVAGTLSALSLIGLVIFLYGAVFESTPWDGGKK